METKVIKYDKYTLCEQILLLITEKINSEIKSKKLYEGNEQAEMYYYRGFKDGGIIIPAKFKTVKFLFLIPYDELIKKRVVLFEIYLDIPFDEYGNSLPKYRPPYSDFDKRPNEREIKCWIMKDAKPVLNVILEVLLKFNKQFPEFPMVIYDQTVETKNFS